MSKRNKTGDWRMRDENYRAFLELFRGVFGEREFISEEVASATGLTRQSARVWLARFYRLGELKRRRAAGTRWIYSLKETRGVVRWRKKDCELVSDRERTIIAKVATRRALKIYSEFGSRLANDVLQETLIAAYEDGDYDDKPNARCPKAWQYVLIRNRAFRRACDFLAREATARRRARRFKAGWTESRARAAHEVERAKRAETLANQVLDVAVEVGSLGERRVVEKAFEGVALDHGADYIYAASLARKCALELFDADDAALSELAREDEDREILTTPPTALAKKLNVTNGRAYKKRDQAARRVAGTLIESCLNGDVELPRRENKNLRLWKQLEAAGL